MPVFMALTLGRVALASKVQVMSLVLRAAVTVHGIILKLKTRRLLLKLQVYLTTTVTRDIDIAILSVRDVPALDENGLTYRHSFFHPTVGQSF